MSRARLAVAEKPAPASRMKTSPARKPRSAKPTRDRAATSLADKAYELIKTEIITCSLRPGQYVNEGQLCDRLGIGRTPVHQAIGQLQQENFVDIIPRKGIIVRPISLDEYFSLDEARLLIEVGAMRIAAERITADEIGTLERIIDGSKVSRRARDLRALLLSDRNFHFVLADATHNPVLTSMLKAAYERSLRVWFVSSANMIIADSSDDHERLVGALKRGDGDKAATIMREHILSSRAYTMRSE